MDFLKNNKTLVGLGVAIALAVAGLVFKVDVPALLNSVASIDKQITAISAPAPTAPAQ